MFLDRQTHTENSQPRKQKIHTKQDNRIHLNYYATFYTQQNIVVMEVDDFKVRTLIKSSVFVAFSIVKVTSHRRELP
jgi:hypothetical protein